MAVPTDKSVAEQLDKLVVIVKNQLYFATERFGNIRRFRSSIETVYFSIDNQFVYCNYYSDFGPYNLSCLCKYCTRLSTLLQTTKGLRQIVHHANGDLEKKTNAACLMGCFAVLYLKMQPREVLKRLSAAGPFKNFLDASQNPSQFEIRMIDVWQAMAKASMYNFVNFKDFNEVEYDRIDQVQHGNMNWLLPGKFLAIVGPTSERSPAGYPPEFYIKYFKQNDVKTVIRLNNRLYDENVFRKAGIAHYDLMFPDGSTPPKEILLKFLEIAENSPAGIAVHCKAGLGRTGTLIAAYIIKHYHFSAREAIAWLRVCRPGSVIGQQQVWLEKLEKWLWKAGSQFRRLKHFGDLDKIPCHKYGLYSRMQPPVETSSFPLQVRKREPQSQFRDLSQLLSSVHGLAPCQGRVTVGQTSGCSQTPYRRPGIGLTPEERASCPRTCALDENGVGVVGNKRSIKREAGVAGVGSVKPAPVETQGDRLVSIKANRALKLGCFGGGPSDQERRSTKSKLRGLFINR